MQVYNINILLVDDSFAAKTQMNNLLVAMGFKNISKANDAREALKIVQEGSTQFDLMILDYRMPFRTGLEFVEQLKEKNLAQTTTFFMLTAETDEEILLDAIEKGVFWFFNKPINKEELKKAIFFAFPHLLKTE